MKFGDLEFDPSIGDALKNGKLVIFIGAGASMGPPANMPNFNELAAQIARGTPRKENEPVERFLGRLKDKSGINVHQNAAEILDIKDKKPNSLHRDLLRLFGTSQKVRIVTTNFDLLLEVAAGEFWSDVPDIYSAPALPRGNNFTGIVHIHGSIKRPQEMVLTDADYGRAYLTEGWAKQFLVDLFYNYTVLFVGYSHDDRVMQYLSRGLPIERIGNRFGLTEETRKSNWEELDIPPISFPQPEGDTDYSSLDGGIQKFADYYASGMKEWQSRIEEIKDADPNNSLDVGDQVLTILQDTSIARLFTKSTNSPKWLIWLDSQNILQELFQPNLLTERSDILALWISEQYVLQYPSVVIQLLIKHGCKLNPAFWIYVCRALTHGNINIKNVSFKRYVTILINSIPKGNSYGIFWLAEQCAERKDIEGLLNLFFIMCSFEVAYRCYSSIEIEAENENYMTTTEAVFRADNYETEEVWQLLKPYISEISDRLIPYLYGQLINLHGILVAWNMNESSFDKISSQRNAIDPDIEKGISPSTIDVIIDAILDGLKWFSENEPIRADYWTTLFLKSKVTILVRIAIYTMGIRTDLSVDYRMEWLLENVDIYDEIIRPEVYLFIKHSYLTTSIEMREKLIERIMAHDESEYGGYSAIERTDFSHFELLSWLVESDMSCPLASKILFGIKSKHPMWKPNEHPNILFYSNSGIYNPKSPHTADELIKLDPKSELEKWLNFEGEPFDGPNRDGLFREIVNACKEDFAWGISLFQALIDGSHWNNKLLADLIWAWNDLGLSNEEWMRIIPLLSSSDLYETQVQSLSHLVRHSINKHELSSQVIEKINSLAHALWPYAICVPSSSQEGDWFILSVSNPVGKLAEFWLLRLKLLLSLSTSIKEPQLSEELGWIENIISTDSKSNVYARFLCARYLGILVALSLSWTEKHLLPFFTSTEDDQFQSVWCGYLSSLVCSLPIIDMLLPAITDVSKNTDRLPPDYIEYFALLLVLIAFNYLDKDFHEIILQFLRNTDSTGKAAFFSKLENYLRSSAKEHKEKLWDKWIFKLIHQYANGLYGKPCKKSLAALIRCLPYLDHNYPLAINEIVNIPINDEFDSIYLGSFEESDLVEHFPKESAKLLIYLIPHLPFHKSYSIQKIISHLKDLDKEENDRLIDVIIRKGWHNCSLE